MASTKLDPKDFGLKLYSRFPPSYRADDADQKYALKRYLETAADGGFKYIIEEQNGLLDLINPQTSPLEVIYLLYEQYGLDLFHGIPEEFLRAFLPNLGLAWAKKGSLDVVEYIVSSLSGIKTSMEVTYDDFDNPLVWVRLEMDFSVNEYFPDTEQFNRILQHFIPFYCDALLIYSYVYYEYGDLHGDEYLSTFIWDKKSELGTIPYGVHWAWTPLTNTDKQLNVDFILNDFYGHGCEDTPLLNCDRELNNDFILNQDITKYKEYETDSFIDKFIYTLYESGIIINTGTRGSGGVPLLNTDKSLFGDFVLGGDMLAVSDGMPRPILNFEERVLNNNFILNDTVDTEDYLDKIWIAPQVEQSGVLSDDVRVDKFNWIDDEESGVCQYDEEEHEEKLIYFHDEESGITNKRIIGGSPVLNVLDVQLNNNFILNDGVFHNQYMGDILTQHLNSDVALNDNFDLNGGIVFPSDGLQKSLLNVSSRSLNGTFILNDYAEMEEYLDKIYYKVIKDELDLSGSDLLQDQLTQDYNESVSIWSKGGKVENDATLGNAVLGEAVLSKHEDFADICEDRIIVSPMVSSGNLENTMDTFTNTEYNRLNSSFVLSPMTLRDSVIVHGKLNDNFVLNGGCHNETTEIISVLSPAV